MSIFVIALAVVWYGAGARALLARTHAARARIIRRTWLFGAGILVSAVALLSPLDRAAEALFSAHMTQHILLIAVVAPLVALSAPAAALWWGMPRAFRMLLGRAWGRSRALRGAWHAITAPPVVFMLSTVVLWFWHFPRPYQAALRHDALHALEHASFLVTAILFWWVVLQPAGHRRLGSPGAIAFLIATLMESGALGALLAYANVPWYPAHIAPTIARGRDPLVDQQLAGVIMWVPAGVVYLGAATAIFYRWLMAEEERSPLGA